MASTISLAGIAPVEGETRALAHLVVDYNGNTYNWQIYIPPDTTDINSFLANSQPTIESTIDAKEAAWAALNPKTRTIPGRFPGQPDITVDIPKEEIVRPDIPDYYALRRNEYPPIADQIGAFWKGPTDPDYIAMQAKVAAVKAKYPKP